MEEKLEKLQDNIYNNVQTFHEITCTKCRKLVQEFGGDEWQIVEYFINKGWHATENNCYCPECNEKRKK